MLFFRKLSPTRLLKGGFFTQVAEAEASGASKEELLALIGTGRSRIGMFEGDLEEGELEIGQVASLLNSPKTVAEIFDDIKSGYASARNRMLNL
jgi:enoyl-[acyl-carrier protein] reductase II